MNKTYWILVFFGFIGMLVLSTALHEFSHYKDFKEIAEEEELCLLNYNPAINGSLGYYSFYPNNYSEYEKINKYTEWKAYGISTVVIALFLFSVFNSYFNNVRKI